MLRIPKTVDYGLLVLMALDRAGDGARRSAQDLAEATNLPASHVAKILKVLQRSCLVGSVRGPSGGYFLNAPSRQITAACVLAAFEGPVAVTECLGSSACECKALPQCELRPHMMRINSVLEEALSSLTLHKLSQGAAPIPGVMV
jgi:Rrf2 family protein